MFKQLIEPALDPFPLLNGHVHARCCLASGGLPCELHTEMRTMLSVVGLYWIVSFLKNA